MKWDPAALRDIQIDESKKDMILEIIKEVLDESMNVFAEIEIDSSTYIEIDSKVEGDKIEIEIKVVSTVKGSNLWMKIVRKKGDENDNE